MNAEIQRLAEYAAAAHFRLSESRENPDDRMKADAFVHSMFDLGSASHRFQALSELMDPLPLTATLLVSYANGRLAITVHRLEMDYSDDRWCSAGEFAEFLLACNGYASHA